jgi:hypothetical protein
VTLVRGGGGALPCSPGSILSAEGPPVPRTAASPSHIQTSSGSIDKLVCDGVRVDFRLWLQVCCTADDPKMAIRPKLP